MTIQELIREAESYRLAAIEQGYQKAERYWAGYIDALEVFA